MHRTTRRFSPLRRFRSPRRTGLLLAGAVALMFSLGTAASASAASVYWVVNVNSGKALGPQGHSKSENARSQQMTYFNGSGGAHHWKISSIGNGYIFENRHSHKCISSVDHEPQYPLAANGTPTIQRTCEYGAGVPQRGWAQRWYVSSVSNMWAGKPVHAAQRAQQPVPGGLRLLARRERQHRGVGLPRPGQPAVAARLRRQRRPTRPRVNAGRRKGGRRRGSYGMCRVKRPTTEARGLPLW